MVFPPSDPTAPPETIGTNPHNATEVNGLVGLHLKQFMTNKAVINQDQAFFGVTDLKAAPYYFTSEQEATIKSCFTDLDAALDAIDTTFISRLIGMP